ncbi:unnamed protein product [Lampetra planeri]
MGSRPGRSPRDTEQGSSGRAHRWLEHCPVGAQTRGDSGPGREAGVLQWMDHGCWLLMVVAVVLTVVAGPAGAALRLRPPGSCGLHPWPETGGSVLDVLSRGTAAEGAGGATAPRPTARDEAWCTRVTSSLGRHHHRDDGGVGPRVTHARRDGYGESGGSVGEAGRAGGSRAGEDARQIGQRTPGYNVVAAAAAGVTARSSSSSEGRHPGEGPSAAGPRRQRWAAAIEKAAARSWPLRGGGPSGALGALSRMDVVDWEGAQAEEGLGEAQRRQQAPRKVVPRLGDASMHVAPGLASVPHRAARRARERRGGGREAAFSLAGWFITTTRQSARVRTLTAGDVVVHARCVHAATSLKAPACHCGHEALASAPRKPRQPRGAHWRRARSARGGVLTRQRRCSSAAARRCYPRVGPAQRLSPRANGVRGRRRHMELVLRFLQLRRDSTALSALRHRCSFSLRLFLRPLDKALGMLER